MMASLVTIAVLADLAATAPPASAYGNTNLELVLGMLLFALAGFGIVFAGLLIGKIVRPTMPHPEKS
ncbi:MAG: hypothetical protein AAB385_04355, partial [Planctomycetota bacterium]